MGAQYEKESDYGKKIIMTKQYMKREITQYCVNRNHYCISLNEKGNDI